MRLSVLLILILLCGCQSTHRVRCEPRGVSLSYVIPTDYKVVESASAFPDQEVSFQSKSYGRLNVRVGPQLEPEQAGSLEDRLKASRFLVNIPKLDTHSPHQLGNGSQAIRVRHKGRERDIEYLFFLHEDRLISFESDFHNKFEKGQKEIVDQIASTLEVGGQPRGTLMAFKKDAPESASKSSGFGPYLDIIGLVLATGLLALPIYIGSGRGFDSEGQPAKGAVVASAMGAFSGALFSICLAAGLAFLFALGSFIGHDVPGIASGGGAVVLSGFVILMLGTAALGTVGFMSALGAALGARTSRKWAQRMAVSFGALGVFLIPLFLQIMELTKRSP